MSSLHSLSVIVIILCTLIGVITLFQKCRLNAILGYLAAGILIGPYGLQLINNNQTVHLLADLGIIFLLFTIGLELSLSRIKTLSRYIFGLGGLQVFLTGCALTALGCWLGWSIQVAFVIGFSLSLSSTAFCSKLLSDQQLTATRFGRLSIAVLVMQDLAVVPLLTVIPILNQSGDTLSMALLMALLKAVAAISLIILIGRWLLRPLFRWIATYKNSELFMAVSLLAILGTGWVTAISGLSVELGAFLAGLLLAESEYRHQVAADIKPFKGTLIGLFFISIGMSIDTSVVQQHLGAALFLLLGLLIIKSGVLFCLARSFKLSLALSSRMALFLAQGGEFAFLILALAMANDVVPTATGQLLLLVVTLSMVLTPALAELGRWLERRIETKQATPSLHPHAEEIRELADHVLIAGFGRVGETIAKLLTPYQIRYIGIDSNPKHVHDCRKQGWAVFFGDASQIKLLESLGLSRARAAVVTLDQPHLAAETVSALRQHAPLLPIYARAHDRTHAEILRQAGATDVVLEAIESSLQLGKMALLSLELNTDSIQQSVDALRQESQV